MNVIAIVKHVKTLEDMFGVSAFDRLDSFWNHLQLGFLNADAQFFQRIRYSVQVAVISDDLETRLIYLQNC